MYYCESIHQTRRLKTRVVQVGRVGVGGSNPVRIQSMTTTPTHDIEATVEQIARLSDAGCEIARVTVQGMREAKACEGIKNLLIQRGYEIPLVADIHFYPPAAMHVVEFVDKVRINPGNFVDRRATFRKKEYDDADYALEIERIEEKFAPLVERCIALKKALRIGTNHGSLSDRIMNRYGDTSFGMVESAFEFARVCRKYDFHNFLFSMKASNPLVMIEAYRLLVKEMIKLGWDYPLHLGVTEAGEGEDGRIKSAVGMGALLLDGLGDTIRVSLTEDPVSEIDPCKRLISLFEKYEGRGIEPFDEQKRGEPRPCRKGLVALTVTEEDIEKASFFEEVGCQEQLSRPLKGEMTPDYLLYEGSVLPPKLRHLQEIGVEVLGPTDYAHVNDASDFDALLTHPPKLILFSTKRSRLHEARRFAEWLKNHPIEAPVLLHFFYECDWDDFIIESSAECGALLADKVAEGLALVGTYPVGRLREHSFNLLQATRLRTFKTEFISCPGCGRTLFDLQEVSKKIRERTAHLPGVRIAIMGCIVNGPGEMADADFGYVGSKAGQIDLYVGKECVERGIPDSEAVERLVELIKSHGLWKESNQLVSQV